MRMALKISSLSASLVMFVVGADFPAQAQFMTSYPAIIVVPPPAQNYAVVKPANRSAAADKLKASVDPPETRRDSEIPRPDARSLDCRRPRAAAFPTMSTVAIRNDPSRRLRSSAGMRKWQSLADGWTCDGRDGC